jgi:broad specificity phosphatase PhoE
VSCGEDGNRGMDQQATDTWKPSARRRIYLMRHGEVDYFAPDGRPLRPESVSLNAEGRRQAEAAGRLLADVPLDRVVTSGLPRSVETARLVIAPRKLPLETRPDMREIETGPLRMLGEPISLAVEQAFVSALHGGLQPTDRFLGGETFGALLARVWPCFQELLAERDWQQLLIVAHGVVNLTLLSQVLGARLAGLGALEQENGCINLLDVEDSGRCLVQALNFTPLNPLKAGMQMTTMERLYLQYRRFRNG